MRGNKKTKLILILGMLTAIGPFSIDMYLPGFPDIAKDLHTTVAKIALSLSSFFIGISIGQLFYGPLLDRFGRKKPLYVGIIIYVIASIGCTFSLSADALIGFRFFQALGSCSGLVASRAMIRDLFPVSENAKVFSLLMLVVGVSPIIAPTLGGYLTTEYSWRYVFIVLTIMAIIILVALHYYLPESRKPDASVSLKPSNIVKGYLEVAKEPQFYIFALSGAIAAAGLYSYIAGSPQVFIQIYRVSKKQYGWIFASIALGLIICSQLNSRLLKKYTSQQIILKALFIQSATGFVLVLGIVQHWYNVYETIGFCLIFLSCQGFIFPNTTALSLAPFSNNAGSASALLGSIQLGMGALATGILSFLTNDTAVPMAAVMAACSLLSLSILIVGRNRIKQTETL